MRKRVDIWAKIVPRDGEPIKEEDILKALEPFGEVTEYTIQAKGEKPAAGGKHDTDWS